MLSQYCRDFAPVFEECNPCLVSHHRPQLIVRCDDQGVSSMMRWLFRQHQFQDPVFRFLRTRSWNLEIVLCHYAEMANTS